MLDETTRAAILRLRLEGHGTRRIATALGISRNAVREVLRAGTAEVPRLERPELGDAHRAEIAILDLLGMNRDTELEVETDGKRLILSPSQAPSPAPVLLRYGPNAKGFANLDFLAIQNATISFGPVVVQPDGKVRNPKKGEPRRRFAKYKAGMSVAEALAAGITGDDIRWDVEHRFIVLGESKR